MAPRPTKLAPRCPQDAPRCLQDGPRWGQVGTKLEQKAIKNPDQQTDQKMLPKKSRDLVRAGATLCGPGGGAPYKLLNQPFQGTVMGH